ncbi:WbqC family protein [Halomonas sp. MES3-P3E]|uniref:WbqC family protein n=1 Tax=Halomonas sp. MES3-P3E TaxID=2058321 RepID=UPI000C34C155|nr:WbqC family protein [Halomonas sp. MES3-P3E]PKG54901.1 glycine transferase [Halomonas sp. MES3-P3E]
MKIGIMQPYFFPYLGYFSLIKNVDLFITLDEVKYIRHGWVDRNRILHPEKGWQYIKIPVRKHSSEKKIRDVFINNDHDWKKRILGQIQHYKKKSPHYEAVNELVKDIFNDEFESIAELNNKSLRKVCDYLGIQTRINVFSDMELTIAEPKAPGEWALNICAALPDSFPKQYWNPVDGRNLFDTVQYSSKKIEIKFFDFSIRPYPQSRHSFEERLSIIDVMMFNETEEIENMLNDYRLIPSSTVLAQ